MRDTPIYSPAWLAKNSSTVDTVIFAFEEEYEKEITKNLIEMCGPLLFKFFS